MITAYQWFADGRPIKSSRLPDLIRLLFEEGHTVESARDYLYRHTDLSSGGKIVPSRVIAEKIHDMRKKLNIDYHMHWYLKGEAYASDER
jgi:hypothetical protein